MASRQAASRICGKRGVTPAPKPAGVIFSQCRVFQHPASKTRTSQSSSIGFSKDFAVISLQAKSRSSRRLKWRPEEPTSPPTHHANACSFRAAKHSGTNAFEHAVISEAPPLATRARLGQSTGIVSYSRVEWPRRRAGGPRSRNPAIVLERTTHAPRGRSDRAGHGKGESGGSSVHVRSSGAHCPDHRRIVRYRPPCRFRSRCKWRSCRHRGPATGFAGIAESRNC